MDRIAIQWTEAAKAGLAALPRKVRRGLLDKANELLAGGAALSANKPLIGILQGYYRICYSRYRAIYRVDVEKLPRGGTVRRITVIFVAVGIRKEGDKKDVYRLAQKLVALGLIKPTKTD